MARKEGKAAYIYKGRTYIFAKIDNPNPRINTYTELTGVNNSFILNGKLVHSIKDINKKFKREDIKSLSFISKEDLKKKYGIEIGTNSIANIETGSK
ncbi:MAG: hypothetical protein H6549_09185 [Chitinophagales bacterium]|nr:hypothetical protein [Chitinophagales bacterium]